MFGTVNNKGRAYRSVSDPIDLSQKNKNSLGNGYQTPGESEDSLAGADVPNIAHGSDLLTDLDRDSYDNMLINNSSRRGSAPIPVDHNYQNMLNGLIRQKGDRNTSRNNTLSTIRSDNSSRAMSTGYLYIPTPEVHIDTFMDKDDVHQVSFFFFK
jgi:hypothetical protein